MKHDKGYVCLIITLIFRWKMREMGTFASMHQQDCCCLSALRNNFLLSLSTLPQVTSLILLAILGLLPSSQTVSSSSRVNNYTSSLTVFFVLRGCKALHSPVPISALSPGRMQGNLNPWKIKWIEKLALYIKRSLHLWPKERESTVGAVLCQDSFQSPLAEGRQRLFLMESI